MPEAEGSGYFEWAQQVAARDTEHRCYSERRAWVRGRSGRSLRPLRGERSGSLGSLVGHRCGRAAAANVMWFPEFAPFSERVTMGRPRSVWERRARGAPKTDEEAGGRPD